MNVASGENILATGEAGCRLLLFDDLQDGCHWRGVTAANPLQEEAHQLLGAALRPSKE